MPTLLEGVLPRFDASEHHAIVIAAPAERVWDVLRTAPSGGGIVSLLLRIRAFGTNRLDMPTIDQLLANGAFGLIAEDPQRELLLGIEGPFWQVACKPRPADAATFASPIPPNTARGAWNFLLEPVAGGTRLSTETRVLCSDRAARRKFLAYWLVIRPGSGLIRRMMLRSVKRAAET